MSFEGLQGRLTALQETTTQLKELINRLASLKFQPGSVPLTTDEETSESGELAAEITSTLRDGEEEHELLQEEVEFLRGADHDRDRLKESVEKIGKELESCRLYFRKARLLAKYNLAQAQRREREILLTSFSQPTSETNSLYPDDEKPSRPTRHQQNVQKQQSSLTEEDQQNVGASANVTIALRRTHDLIQAELARSEFAHETLTESSAALKQLNESYGSLDTMLASSKDLLGTLLRSQKSDTWYLQTTFYMLACTLGWLLFRRLLYGPMWWIIWLPLRLIFGLGTSAGSAVMHAGSGQGQVKEAVQASKGAPVEGLEGLPNDELPTVKVATQQKAEVSEELDKIVNVVREADDLGNIPEGDEDNIGNPKKRMWEEPDVVEQQRPRDEL
ncbi:hypothetical protein FGADI_4677 [Fusarium gaditjirri]|uniref:Sec20 C-terminal domain-containing protein n=1 Tax=Fusarium gaditjirri TaxID=282569 RepID=A0A8H4TC91_9HYPO|nr:hypothetical protein FGADI_4677 [Fusarium gaditjirri]